MNKIRLIGSAESTTIEWKKSPAEIKEVIETIAAFSNAEGGKVFIGVSPEGNVVGVQIGKGTVEGIANQIGQHTDPKVMPKITVKKINGKDVIVIDVKESPDRLVLAYGRPHKRVGRSSPKMGKDEYERLILEKHRYTLPFDAEVCKGASISDIDAEKVMHFLSVAKEERGIDIDPKSSVKDVLMRLNLIKGSKLTNAAILLFGKKPRSFFTQSESKCVRFKGLDVTGEMIDIKPINGDIVSQLKSIENFIYDHIFKKAWIESGKMERQEKWEYPPKAIREALANAMAHRDYRTTSKVQVRIFDDRIEFWNPAILPPGWTAETLKRKHESKPFNPLLAEAFFWIKYAEEIGTGTDKIIKWCRSWGLPDAEFEYAGSSLVVTFRKLGLSDQALGQLELTDRQMKAIRFVQEKGSITNKQYRELTGLSDEGARLDLVDMVEKKALRIEGSGRTVSYRLS